MDDNYDVLYDPPNKYTDSLQQLKHGEAASILQDQGEDWDEDNRLYDNE